MKIGDWFVVPNRVSGLHSPEADGVHPMLVRSAWPGPRLSLLPRSTSVAEGYAHGAHGENCGSSSCRLNRDGWISEEVESVDEVHVTEFSCHEPDDDVIEWAMRVGAKHPRRGRRRR